MFSPTKSFRWTSELTEGGVLAHLHKAFLDLLQINRRYIDACSSRYSCTLEMRYLAVGPCLRYVGLSII